MDEIPGECPNQTGASCSNTRCECEGIDIAEVRIKSPAEKASDQMVKWDKWIKEENKKRKEITDEDRYLPQIIKEEFYRQQLFQLLIKFSEQQA